MIDLAKIKPGDELTIRCRAKRRTDDGSWVVECLDKSQTTVRLGDVVSHTPKAPEVGDRVRDGVKVGALIAVHFMRGWVEYADNTYGSPLLSDLERAQ